MTLKISPYTNGLYPAANSTSTGYNRIWIRDNVYVSLGLETINIKEALKTIHALLDILLKHEYKIDWMIKQPHPKHKHRYIHPRYDKDGNEILEEWGNKQNDAIGALLWRIGELNKTQENQRFSGPKKFKGFFREINVLRNNDDKKIVQKIVNYLEAVEYWKDKDNGIWEENEELHASSIGACLAGLLNVQDLVNVPLHLIAHGEENLKKTLAK